MLTLHREIPAHPDQVWHLLTDLEAWPIWGPTVRRAETAVGGD